MQVEFCFEGEDEGCSRQLATLPQVGDSVTINGRSGDVIKAYWGDLVDTEGKPIGQMYALVELAPQAQADQERMADPAWNEYDIRTIRP